MHATAATTPDPAARDCLWLGYHPRAMFPTIVAAGAASWLAWLGRWSIVGLAELAERIGALAVFVLAWGIWPFLLSVFVYRTVTYTYRLTPHAILIDFGFMHPPTPPVPLDQITAIVVESGPIRRWLGVGAVVLHAGPRTVRLPGIYRPERLVTAIRQMMESAGSRSPLPMLVESAKAAGRTSRWILRHN